MILVDNNSCECTSARIHDEKPNVNPLRSKFIFDEFAFSFRQKTNIDPFLRIVGIANYVNAILMLELAMMLIMENMRINEKMTRNIFYQSAKLGELFNEKTSVTMNV